MGTRCVEASGRLSSPELISSLLEDAYTQPHNDLSSWRWKIMSFASKLSAVIFYNC